MDGQETVNGQFDDRGTNYIWRHQGRNYCPYSNWDMERTNLELDAHEEGRSAAILARRAHAVTRVSNTQYPRALHVKRLWQLTWSKSDEDRDVEDNDAYKNVSTRHVLAF